MTPRIAGEFAFNLETGTDTASQDIEGLNHHFYGFDYKDKFQLLIADGGAICLYAQHADIKNTELIPDVGLSNIVGNSYGYGVESTTEVWKHDRTRAHCVVLQAVRPGHGRLNLVDTRSKKILDSVEVRAVPEQRRIKAKFYTIVDKSGRRGLSRESQATYHYSYGFGLSKVIGWVNDIIYKQCGISVELHGGVGGHIHLVGINAIDVELGDNPTPAEMNSKVAYR